MVKTHQIKKGPQRRSRSSEIQHVMVFPASHWSSPILQTFIYMPLKLHSKSLPNTKTLRNFTRSKPYIRVFRLYCAAVVFPFPYNLSSFMWALCVANGENNGWLWMRCLSAWKHSKPTGSKESNHWLIVVSVRKGFIFEMIVVRKVLYTQHIFTLKWSSGKGEAFWNRISKVHWRIIMMCLCVYPCRPPPHHHHA